VSHDGKEKKPLLLPSTAGIAWFAFCARAIASGFATTLYPTYRLPLFYITDLFLIYLKGWITLVYLAIPP
jgi:hypothetical protein